MGMTAMANMCATHAIMDVSGLQLGSAAWLPITIATAETLTLKTRQACELPEPIQSTVNTHIYNTKSPARFTGQQMADQAKLHEALLEEVKSPHTLRHITEMHDASSPVIDPDVHIGKFPKEQLLSEIQKGVPLNHVQDDLVHDASKPIIEPGIKLQKNNHDALMDEVRTKGSHHAAMEELKDVFLHQAHEGGLPLHHVQTNDKSAPHIQ